MEFLGDCYDYSNSIIKSKFLISSITFSVLGNTKVMELNKKKKAELRRIIIGR